MDHLGKLQLAGRNAFGLYLPSAQKFALLQFNRRTDRENCMASGQIGHLAKAGRVYLTSRYLGHLMGSEINNCRTKPT
jgi:hypothetical protein